MLEQKVSSSSSNDSAVGSYSVECRPNAFHDHAKSFFKIHFNFIVQAMVSQNSSVSEVSGYRLDICAFSVPHQAAIKATEPSTQCTQMPSYCDSVAQRDVSFLLHALYRHLPKDIIP
jgi:hypothetical protein